MAVPRLFLTRNTCCPKSIYTDTGPLSTTVYIYIYIYIYKFMRRKGMKRTKENFYVGEKEIAIVEEYKYLG